MTLRPAHPSSACVALLAAAVVPLGACSRPAQDDTPPPGPSAASSASIASPRPPSREKPTPLEFESGKGEVLVDKHVPELWVPDVEVRDLAVHRNSLWWSDDAGIHERPFDGEVRAVLPGADVRDLVADEDGVAFVVVTNRKHFDLKQISADARSPRKLTRMPCVPLDLALARDFVVVAATCGIFAVPRKGGAPRRLEPETHRDISIAADREQVCYVNDHRLSCRSLVDLKARPRVLDALRPGPLLLDRQVLYALEEGRLSDVPIFGDYGRLVRWEIPTGERWVLTTQQYAAHALHRDDRAIYYGTEGGSVRRVVKDGSQVQTLHHVNQLVTPRLAVGGGYIHFALHSERGIRRLRIGAE